MHLDPSIRDWVMIPILIVMILVGLLRSHATLLLQSRPKVDKDLVRESQALMKSARLRNVKILSPRKHGNLQKLLLKICHRQTVLESESQVKHNS